MPTPQTRAELLAHLREQSAFMNASAAAFDAGEESEAKRLALALRILLHDHGQSRSLLGQIGVKQTLSFADVVGEISPAARVAIPLRMSFGPNGMRYHAKTDGCLRSVPFDEWWNATVYRSLPEKMDLSRKAIVLDMADKDGGAHVDPSIGDEYARLSRNDIWQLSVDGKVVEGPRPGPANVYIRQIAYEVLATLANGSVAAV